MDQRAERVVHNSMVNVTCKAESAQYFLITPPKLLPDLMYHERMKILCVNNGEWLPDDRNLGKMMNMIDGYVASRRNWKDIANVGLIRLGPYHVELEDSESKVCPLFFLFGLMISLPLSVSFYRGYFLDRSHWHGKTFHLTSPNIHEWNPFSPHPH